MNLLKKMIKIVGGADTFWESVVESMSEAIFIINQDRKIVYWNKRAEEITGFKKEEVVGKDCLTGVKCEECYAGCNLFKKEYIKEKELIFISKDGREIPIIKNARILKSKDGKIIGGIEAFRDITLLKEENRAKEEAYRLLNQEKELYQGVVESISEGVIILDEKLRLKSISRIAQTIINLPANDVIDKRITELFKGPITEKGGHLETSVAKRMGVYHYPTEIITKEGSIIPVCLSIYPLQEAENPQNKKGWIILLKDLREEERMFLERKAIPFGSMISRNPKMMDIFKLIDSVSQSDVPVLIQGESGTGKELVALELHKRSRRASGPFHPVNCGGLSRELLESEFFGHEKGAFTGAIRQKKGRFELADGGTIFLDEIAELPLDLQPKLLRVIETQEFERVGGTETIKVNVRIVAATNKDLSEMVKIGKFREDLYYRLNVVPIYLPPLRERKEDIEALIFHYIERLNQRERKKIKGISKEALKMLLDYSWPGNIRELINVLEYCFAVAPGSFIRPIDLPNQFHPKPDEALILSSHEGEAKRIEKALLQSHYNIKKAAELLGIDRTTLWRKRKRYRLL